MKIDLINVGKRIGVTWVLSDINMHLCSGSVYGFQGINGSGKTMLMRTISGLVHPSRGEILINDVPLAGENNFPQNMGLVIETPSFLADHSGFANLKMLADLSVSPISDDKILSALERLGIADVAHKKVKKYSLGMRQRLGIACAIMEEPELLILDEPFNSIDESGIETLRQIIAENKARGALIIVACHDSELLNMISDEVFKLVAGEVTRHTKKDASGVFHEVQI